MLITVEGGGSGGGGGGGGGDLYPPWAPTPQTRTLIFSFIVNHIFKFSCFYFGLARHVLHCLSQFLL
jgi:hypothetical protein